jgi:KipI family sensor histidine kinase inhibitor
VSKYPLSIRPFGVHAILVEWPNEVQEAILDDIIQFTSYLESNCLNVNKWEIVPAYNSVTLILREQPIDFDKLKQRLGKWYQESDSVGARKRYLWRLPVCYDIEFGIDINEVSEKLQLSISELIQEHTSNVYTVYGIGFLPGFMYLGGVPSRLEIPRKSAPRLNVQKGSVGLASKQTGIYPQESPGGWNIIGNCPVSMFNPKNEEPCFVSVGDKVQFFGIEKAAYDLHKIENEVGIYKLDKTELDA